MKKIKNKLYIEKSPDTCFDCPCLWYDYKEDVFLCGYSGFELDKKYFDCRNPDCDLVDLSTFWGCEQ